VSVLVSTGKAVLPQNVVTVSLGTVYDPCQSLLSHRQEIPYKLQNEISVVRLPRQVMSSTL
jgi:hypothetical protein